MLSIRSSNAKGKNPDFKRVPRKKGEDNLKWLARNAPKGDVASLVLLGGVTAVDFRIRVAQSHARHNLTPSHWSHVALLPELDAAKPGKSRIFEISLQPADGFGYPPITNAVQESALDRYRDPEAWPNVAIVYVPLEREAIERVLRKFTFQRSALDAVELVVAWLGFLWGVGRTPNPLMEGLGVPSATMVEYVLGGLQYELTPGLDSRSSCPEAIWQSAMWWHEYYEQSGGKKLEGRWVVEHGLVDRKNVG
jgi:hypothetical protein